MSHRVNRYVGLMQINFAINSSSSTCSSDDIIYVIDLPANQQRELLCPAVILFLDVVWGLAWLNVTGRKDRTGAISFRLAA